MPAALYIRCDRQQPTCHFKHHRRALETRSASRITKLLHVRDPLTHYKFLIDTGAEVSVLPATELQTSLPQVTTLYAANSTDIPVYKRQTLKLDLGLRRSFQWTFYVAAVSQAILGADFLAHYNLLVDIRNRRLLDSITQLAAPADLVHQDSTKLSAVCDASPFSSLLKSFPELTQPYSATTPVKHNVQHFIETTGPPVYAKARRLPPHRFQLAKAEFENLMRQGIIRPSSSNWSSALHIVDKKNGDIRPCGDYRALNSRTVVDRYPVPNIQEFSSQLHGKKVFSRIDLVKAFHQIPVNPADIPKTALITPFGLFEYVRMPFGLRNAAQTFQRFIDEVTRGLDFCFAYIDDLLIASSDEETHRQHLQQVFTRLRDYGVQLNASKSTFGVPTVTFLGHTVSSAGIAPLQSKCEAIQQFPKPSTQRQLREFLGMVNYYNRFIKNCSLLLQPLYAMIKPAKRGQSVILQWTPAADEAFIAAKQILTDVATLAFPSSDAPTSIVTDASNTGVGAVLQQYTDGGWQPLAFFSKKFSTAETKYSAFDRELLAISKAIKRFRYFIEGRQFHVYTDHKPLASLFLNNKPSYTPRQLRHIEYISEFTTDIRHVRGLENPADALSRVSAVGASPLIDYAAIAAAQVGDPELQQLMQNPALSLKKLQLPGTEVHLYADVSTTSLRPYVPKQHRQPLFQQLHGLSHPGIRASQHMMSSRFIWTGINKDVRAWTRACLHCQSSKVHKHTHSPPGTFPPPSARFDHIHVDIVGPLPHSDGFRYIFTCVDRFTRWPEAVPIADITVDTVARALIQTWVSRYGVPLNLTSDRGSQFESQLWSKLMTLLGVRRHRTSSYHPQANGIVERFHRQLKASLAATTLQERGEWSQKLPLVLLGIRSSLKVDLGRSPAELLYGATLRLPGEFLSGPPPQHSSSIQDYTTDLEAWMSELQPTQPRSSTTKVFVSQDLDTCTHVFVRVDAVRKPLQQPYEGPFRVIRQTRKCVTILRNGKHDTVSKDRVKPAYLLQSLAFPNLESKADTPPVQRPRKSVSFLPTGRSLGIG